MSPSLHDVAEVVKAVAWLVAAIGLALFLSGRRSALAEDNDGDDYAEPTPQQVLQPQPVLVPPQRVVAPRAPLDPALVAQMQDSYNRMMNTDAAAAVPKQSELPPIE